MSQELEISLANDEGEEFSQASSEKKLIKSYKFPPNELLTGEVKLRMEVIQYLTEACDRIEISNPGIPPIKVERFIDENRSRNEQLAKLMPIFGICEEKGSGIDKVVSTAEMFQLPAPDFRVGDTRTTALLFAHQDFADMSKSDRIRACYQHCCLLYVSNQRMSNQTLRERFRLSHSQVATVSLIIGATKEAGLIKADESESTSTRYARYLPFWA
jgi:ATP-dependent DNA helicase RecG